VRKNALSNGILDKNMVHGTSYNSMSHNRHLELINNYLMTKWLGQKIIFLDTIDSTNTECKKRSLTENQGTVILSEEQTAGRGRLGREWISPKGKGIWMSLLLKPDLPPDKIPQTTLVAAASVCTALEAELAELKEFSLQVEVKWPNDILLAGRKAGGILTEMQVSGENVQSVIVGIGLDVNLSEEDFPPMLRDQATSLFLATGRVWERERLIAGVLNSFESLYDKFIQAGELGEALTICRLKSAVIGRHVVLANNGTEQRAEVLDLGPQGELLVRLENGMVSSVVSGEISLKLL